MIIFNSVALWLNRLRELYEFEHQQYIREIGATVETELDRQASQLLWLEMKHICDNDGL
jgi:hypothetical protein